MLRPGPSLVAGFLLLEVQLVPLSLLLQEVGSSWDVHAS
jgi:hypothetical protein